MFLLECPKCKNQMKYQPARMPLSESAKKACVYCGKNFTVRTSIVKNLD